MCCRSDNQICEEFFQKFKAQIVKGGLKSLTTMLHETSKFIRFHSEHDRKELRFHMEPVITNAMWTQMHHMHPMVMACAMSVNTGRRAGGASQGRLNALSQESGSSQHEKSGDKLFTKNDLRAIVIPSSTYLLELDLMRSKTAAQLKQMIKSEQEIYSSLLCQHASEEGAYLSCSPAFSFLPI